MISTLTSGRVALARCSTTFIAVRVYRPSCGGRRRPLQDVHLVETAPARFVGSVEG
jgi:hypothetical protein